MCKLNLEIIIKPDFLTKVENISVRFIKSELVYIILYIILYIYYAKEKVMTIPPWFSIMSQSLDYYNEIFDQTYQIDIMTTIKPMNDNSFLSFLGIFDSMVIYSFSLLIDLSYLEI